MSDPSRYGFEKVSTTDVPTHNPPIAGYPQGYPTASDVPGAAYTGNTSRPGSGLAESAPTTPATKE